MWGSLPSCSHGMAGGLDRRNACVRNILLITPDLSTKPCRGSSHTDIPPHLEASPKRPSSDVLIPRLGNGGPPLTEPPCRSRCNQQGDNTPFWNALIQRHQTLRRRVPQWDINKSNDLSCGHAVALPTVRNHLPPLWSNNRRLYISNLSHSSLTFMRNSWFATRCRSIALAGQRG